VQRAEILALDEDEKPALVFTWYRLGLKYEYLSKTKMKNYGTK
jgi:hypothetical protein